MILRPERKALACWLMARRQKGLPEGCYGIWKWLARVNEANNLVAFKAASKSAAAISGAKSRKRPAWCTTKMWDRWRSYQREVCAGIPLEVYADPVQREAWKEKAGIRRPMTRKQKAEALLRRKGLQPKS